MSGKEERIIHMARMGRDVQGGLGAGGVKGISLRDYHVLAGQRDRVSTLGEAERPLENVQGETEGVEHHNRVRNGVSEGDEVRHLRDVLVSASWVKR